VRFNRQVINPAGSGRQRQAAAGSSVRAMTQREAAERISAAERPQVRLNVITNEDVCIGSRPQSRPYSW